MVGVLVERKGALFVEYQSVSYSAPEVVVMQWRVRHAQGTGYGERPKEGDIVASERDGVWGARDPVTQRSTGKVTVDGSAQADFTETRAVPRPKVRAGVETRWDLGVWLKLTKKGWVRA
jgi:hypothetical protein